MKETTCVPFLSGGSTGDFGSIKEVDTCRGKHEW